MADINLVLTAKYVANDLAGVEFLPAERTTDVTIGDYRYTIEHDRAFLIVYNEDLTTGERKEVQRYVAEGPLLDSIWPEWIDPESKYWLLRDPDYPRVTSLDFYGVVPGIGPLIGHTNGKHSTVFFEVIYRYEVVSVYEETFMFGHQNGSFIYLYSDDISIAVGDSFYIKSRGNIYQILSRFSLSDVWYNVEYLEPIIVNLESKDGYYLPFDAAILALSSPAIRTIYYDQTFAKADPNLITDASSESLCKLPLIYLHQFKHDSVELTPEECTELIRFADRYQDGKLINFILSAVKGSFTKFGNILQAESEEGLVIPNIILEIFV